MSVELKKRNRLFDLEGQREARSDDYRPFYDDVKVYQESRCFPLSCRQVTTRRSLELLGG